MMSASLERWLSGRRHVPAKDAYSHKRVPRVQIPLFPNFSQKNRKKEANSFASVGI